MIKYDQPKDQPVLNHIQHLVSEEHRLYGQGALAEGGKFVVYAGGDAPNQQAAIERAFEARFSGVDVIIKIDLSKYHDAKIDNQLARGTLEPDVAHVQTLHDFDRWKKEGHLLHYKPVGWNQIYPQFKDPDGAFTALNVIAFSNVVNIKLVSESEAPRDAQDYLDPKYKGKLVFTYPNDDDAVLHQFEQIVRKYGWEYMDKLMTQEPRFVRGTATASRIVAEGGAVATFTASGTLAPTTDSMVKFLLPKTDTFLSWPQTAAIFKKAKHPRAARLYLSWWLSKDTQQNVWRLWPVRKDVPAPGGHKPILEYNTDPEGFREFMRDRARVERFKA